MPETAVTIESTPRPAVLPAALPAASAAASAAAMPAVQQALAAIERDSQQASVRYLADSVVPHGGE